MMELQAKPLTQSAFAAFGEVVELERAQQLSINHGLTTRFHDLFTVDTGGDRPLVNVFRTAPLPLPHRVQVMERHPLGSQAFMPMNESPFLVLVAAADGSKKIAAADLSLFITNGRQSINLYKNTWHHHQLVLAAEQNFIVIDRAGDDNLEEREVKEEVWIPAAY